MTGSLHYARAVQQTIADIDRDVTISAVQAMNAVLGDAIAQPRLLTLLLAVFGGLAVLLGGIGIYGVIAYSVAQRRQELGIRAALSAQPGQLLGLVLGESARTALPGIGAGLTAALLLSFVLAGQLHEVHALDPATYVLVALLVLFVALAATLIPARRAGRVQQASLLRE